MLFPRRPEILEPSAADCAEQLPPHVHEIRGARDELLWFDEEQALSALPSARPTVQLSGRSNPLPVPVAMAKPWKHLLTSLRWRTARRLAPDQGQDSETS